MDRPNSFTGKEEEKTETTKNKNKNKNIDIENKGSQHYPRFVLNLRNDFCQSLEEESNLVNGSRFVSSSRDQIKEKENNSKESTKQLVNCLNQAAKQVQNPF